MIEYTKVCVNDEDIPKRPTKNYKIKVSDTQITIPKQALEDFGLKIGDRVSLCLTPRIIRLRKSYRGVPILAANIYGTGYISLGALRTQILRQTKEPKFIPQGICTLSVDYDRDQIEIKEN